MKKFMIILLLVSFITQAFAVDQYNTYRWNRENALSANGKINTKPWYEWWYYKVVLPETGQSFFFVYGVVNPWDKKNTLAGTRSYVGMGDFADKIQVEAKFNAQDFKASYKKTHVSIMNNTATDKHIEGNIIGEHGGSSKWSIDVKHRWTFNATSWATGMGLTNIEWYPAQADARCSGTIESNGMTYNFKDAPCYQDRNWGNSFPAWWAWIVSNQFDGHPDTALAIGGGKPKFLNRWEPIEGVAIGLKHKGKQHTWRPNNFSKVKVQIKFGKWEVEGINRSHKIVLTAYAPPEKFMDLIFITPLGEVFHDLETLTGAIDIKLYKRSNPVSRRWKLVETLHTDYGGIEYGSKDQSVKKSIFSNKIILK